jgi:DNA (cytosine-5)-methyltransferase 1
MIQMGHKFIEVFAGCGGMSTGLIRAGWQPVLMVDNIKDCCETLKQNHQTVFPDCSVKCMSVTDLHLDEYKDKIDLLVGGVPCQAFSQAGKRMGLEDDRGNLFYDFFRLIDECEPRMFLIENVVGLTTHDNGRTFSELVKKMCITETNKLSYKIHHRVLNANDYEVAQKRKRVLIVGIREDEGDFEYPQPLAPKLVIRDVLSNCPESPGQTYSDRKKAVLDLVPPGGCWIDLPDEIKKQYMGKSLQSGGGKRGIARRISWDEACLTLTTSPCQKQTERCHPDETRPFTVREYARIQSFPDAYVFKGGIGSQYKQIGNAVPVNLAYHMGKSLFACV